MPMYDFTCQACGRRFDRLLRTPPKATPDTQGICCPACDSRDVSRGLSLVNVGSGRPSSSPPVSDAPMCGRCGVPGGPCVSN